MALRLEKTVRESYKNVDIGQPVGGGVYRDERIDSIKYFLIILVIIGHVFTQSEFSDFEFCKVVWKWIYIFHMPLFVFLSGYFSHKKDTKDFLLSCWKIVEPLIFYQLLIRTYLFLTTGVISLKDILTPWWALWYLLSLLYWRVMLQFIPDRILNNTIHVAIVSFAIGILVGFLPFDRMLSLQRTFSFLPFFLLGYCLRGKNIFLPSKYRLLCLLFLIGTFIIPLFFSEYTGSLGHATPYSNIYGPFARLFIFCLSIPMSLAFISICPNTSWTARSGKLTMQYYLYHVLIIFFVMELVNRYSIPTTLLSAIVFSILIICFLGGMSYLPIFVKFTNPSLFLKK